MAFGLEECTLNSPQGNICQLKIKDLSPTQNAVGYDEINNKVERIRKKNSNELQDYLISRPVPIIIGNGNKFYLIDHHHLTHSLWKVAKGKNKSGMTTDNARVIVEVLRNWRQLRDYQFWKAMFEARWVYLFDHNGAGPLQPKELFKHVKDLLNDPYRSLSWLVRKRYGYVKSEAPFAEFLWADFFRIRMILDKDTLKNKKPAGDILINKLREEHRKELIDLAMFLASTPEAAGLPGYLGRGS